MQQLSIYPYKTSLSSFFTFYWRLTGLLGLPKPQIFQKFLEIWNFVQRFSIHFVLPWEISFHLISNYHHMKRRLHDLIIVIRIIFIIIKEKNLHLCIFSVRICFRFYAFFFLFIYFLRCAYQAVVEITTGDRWSVKTVGKNSVEAKTSGKSYCFFV